jgi:hypothetical protein
MAHDHTPIVFFRRYFWLLRSHGARELLAEKGLTGLVQPAEIRKQLEALDSAF